MKNDITKSAYDELVKKVNAIDANIKSWKKGLKMSVKKPIANKFIVIKDFNKKSNLYQKWLKNRKNFRLKKK